MAEAPKVKLAAVAEKRGPIAVTRGVSWKLFETVNNTWRCFVDESVTLKDLEDERLWEVVAHELTPFDRITVIREDRGFWADCLCVDSQPGRARVVVLGSVAPLPPMLGLGISRIPDGYDIRHEVATGKWIAFRVGDGAVMNGDGSPSQEIALRTLLDHAVFRK